MAGNRDVVGLLERDPAAGLGAAWSIVIESYAALIRGSLGDPAQLASALTSLDSTALIGAFHPLSETVLSMTPLVFTGLSVALAFRAGLFNIGGEGQLQMGALAAVFVGFSFQGLPWFIHLPLALIAALVGGALWGLIPAVLKARTGAHEVITTIMLNFVAIQLVFFSLRSPLFQRPGRTDPDLQGDRAVGRPATAGRRPACTLGHRSGLDSRGVRVVAAVPIDAGLRVPRGRA